MAICHNLTCHSCRVKTAAKEAQTKCSVFIADTLFTATDTLSGSECCTEMLVWWIHVVDTRKSAFFFSVKCAVCLSVCMYQRCCHCTDFTATLWQRTAWKSSWILWILCHNVAVKSGQWQHRWYMQTDRETDSNDKANNRFTRLCESLDQNGHSMPKMKIYLVR